MTTSVQQTFFRDRGELIKCTTCFHKVLKRSSSELVPTLRKLFHAIATWRARFCFSVRAAFLTLGVEGVVTGCRNGTICNMNRVLFSTLEQIFSYNLLQRQHQKIRSKSKAHITRLYHSPILQQTEDARNLCTQTLHRRPPPPPQSILTAPAGSAAAAIAGACCWFSKSGICSQRAEKWFFSL